MKNQIAGETNEVTRTTRDMFAMAALPELVAADIHALSHGMPNGSRMVAKIAYGYAEAMMAERAKEQP